MNRFLKVLCFSAVIGLLTASPSWAATRNWTNAAANQLFNNPNNWSDIAPFDASDIFNVNVANAATSPKIVTGDVINGTSLFIGPTSPGRLDMSGGSLTVGTFRAGNCVGDTYFNLSGGTVTKTGVGPSARFGWSDGDGTGNVGHFVMSGGTFNCSGNFLFGFGTGTTGYFDMSGGTITSNGVNTAIGFGGTGFGTMSGASSFTQYGEFVVGRPNGAVDGVGTLTMSGTASLDLVNSHLRVGYDGAKGTLNIGAGNNVHVNQWVQIGNNDANQNTHNSGLGVVNMTGGTFTKDAVAGTYMLVGRWAAGEWNQSGGTADIRSILCLGQADYKGALNLNGGTFSVGIIQMGYENDANAIGEVNFNGGTLKVNVNSAYLAAPGGNFINPYQSIKSNLYVKSGGAVIDTSGTNAAIGLPMQTDSVSLGGGLTKIGSGVLTLTGANTYTGATTISGGGFSLKAGSTLASPIVTVNAGGSLDVDPGTATGYNLSALHLTNGSVVNFALGTVASPSDAINVNKGGTGNLDLAGGTGSANLALQIAGRGFAATPYTIFNFNTITGGLGNLNITSGTRATFTKTLTATSLQITLLSQNSKDLTWVNGANANWQTGGPLNWREVVPPSTPPNQTFQELDTIHFTDASANNAVNLVGALHPLDLYVNSGNNYTFGGTGFITGDGTTLTKSGAGTLTIANTGTNDFTGNVSVTGGKVVFSAMSALGLNNSVTVSNASSLAVTGNWLGDGSSRNLSIADTASVSVSGRAVFGQSTGTPCALTMTGGSLTAGDLFIGGDGAGTVGSATLSGGTIVSNGWISVGSGGGTGTATVSGTTQISVPNGYVFVGRSGGQGVWNQNGGTTVSVGAILGENHTTTNSGELDLNGGIFATRFVQVGYSTGVGCNATVNFNGGTMKAMSNNDNFFNPYGSTNFNMFVKAGGAVIDTNGNIIGCTVPLQAGTTSGGLTKLGLGELVLSGANTYTGDTTIQKGTLTLATGCTFPAGNKIIVQSGTVLSGAAATSADVTVNSGGAVVPGISTTSLGIRNLSLAAGAKLITMYDGTNIGSTSVVDVSTGAAGNKVGVGLGGVGGVLLPIASPLPVLYYGTEGGSGAAIPTFIPLVDSIGTANLTVEDSSGTVTATLTDATGTRGWNTISSNWNNAANWKEGFVPKTDAHLAWFDSTTSSPTTPGSVSLDIPVVLSSMLFNSSSGGYTITTTNQATNTITLSSSIAAQSQIQVMGGAHVVSPNIVLTGETPISVPDTAQLTLGGVISGAGGITFSSNGVGNNYSPSGGILTLNGLNTFTGPVVMSGYGRLEIGNIGLTTSANALGKSGPDPGNLVIYGVLAYTGATDGITDRGFALKGVNAGNIYSSAFLNGIEVQNAGANLQFNGQVTTIGASGLRKTGPGTLTFAYGGVNTLAGCDIGVVDGTLVLANGTFNKAAENIAFQNGSGDIWVGDTVGFTPTMSLKSGAAVHANNTLYVGAIGAGVNGTFLMNDGSATSFRSDYEVYIGTSGGTGSLTMNGQASMSTNYAQIGRDGGIGTVVMNGAATFSTDNEFRVGIAYTAASSTATLTMNGNSSASSNYLIIGRNASGNATVTPTGTVAVGDGTGSALMHANQIALGMGPNGSATLNINQGGAVETPWLRSVNDGGLPASSILNFNGGALRATASDTSFVADAGSTLFQLNVLAGGAIIDTQANNDTIVPPLLHGGSGTDGGLKKLGNGALTLAATPTYNGNTTVDAGTLNVGTLSTPAATVYVATGATLNATSITADTLTIGGPPLAAAAAAVPEPGTFVLLVLAGLGAIMAWRRK